MFDTEFDSAFDEILAVMGDTVTYTPYGGDAIEVSCVWDQVSYTRKDDEDRAGQKQQARISVSLDDIGGTVTIEKDIVTNGTEIWTVVDRGDISGGIETLTIERYSSVALQREGLESYR